MQSDITISDENTMLIIDAKFYSSITQSQYENEKLRSGHLYQIFAYVKNAQANCDKIVSGLLLYGQTDGNIQPNETYLMSGNKISANTLNLNQEFSQIAADLNAIADHHFPS